MMNKERKKTYIAEMTAQFEKSEAVLVTHYQGLSVKQLDDLRSKMREKGIEVQIGSYSLHMNKAFNENSQVEIKGDLENSKWCFNHALALPLYNDLTFELQEVIINELNSCL